MGRQWGVGRRRGRESGSESKNLTTHIMSKYSLKDYPTIASGGGEGVTSYIILNISLFRRK